MAGWKRIAVACPVCKYEMIVATVEINDEELVLRLQMDCQNQSCVVHQYGSVISHTVPSLKEDKPKDAIDSRHEGVRATIADRSPSHFAN